MKRIILAVVGTIAGLVSLLSFKTSSPVASGALPSAALPDTGSAAAAGATTAPDPASSATSPSSAKRSSTSSGKSAATAKSSSGKSSSAKPAQTTKTYQGSSVTTRYGVVQVEVTVQGSTITNVQFLQLTAFDGRSQEINSQAGPILLQETLSAQSAHIDTVSGATYTSDGYLQSLQSALDAAGIK